MDVQLTQFRYFMALTTVACLTMMDARAGLRSAICVCSPMKVSRSVSGAGGSVQAANLSSLSAVSATTVHGFEPDNISTPEGALSLRAVDLA